jgi:hypothetical protein
MAKSKITPIRLATNLHDELYAAAAKFAEVRAELVLASTVLSDSAFSGSNAITEERDVSAVLVLQKAVEKLSNLQATLDDISVGLAQPRAIARLNAERKAVANG